MNLHELRNLPSWDWPTDVGTLLVEILQNKELLESDRILATDLSGELGALSDEHAGALLDIVSSENESRQLRARASIALGPALEMADLDECDPGGQDMISAGVFARIKKTLREIYQQQSVPTEVRRRILEVAVRAPEDWQKQAIDAAYESNEDDWLLTAVFCMQFHDGFDKQILEALKSQNELVRYHAVCAAGNAELDEAWSHVHQLACDDSFENPLRIAAIEAAASIRPSAAADILGHLIDSDDPEIAEAAEEVLTMTGTMAAFGANYEIEEDDEDMN